MKVYLIRHSLTEGNLVKRYIGATDQPLCEEGRNLVAQKRQEGIFRELTSRAPVLFASPMKRCRETMELLFPDRDYQVVPELRECDFGKFENKNYKEMSELSEYQEWIDSNGTLPFPEGESREGFNSRTTKAFENVISRCEAEGYPELVFLVHGGSIMAIMDKFTLDENSYYDFYVDNLTGYEIELFDGRIKTYNKIR